MKHYFDNFLEDHKIYVLTENFWSVTIGGMLVEKNIPIKKWLATKNIKGERFYDGDPIFSLIDTKNKRALRIVQLKPQKNKPFVEAWIETRLNQEDKEINVLAITLELSEETKQITIDLVEKWFVKKIPVNKFDKSLIEETVKNVLTSLDLQKIKKIQNYYFSWLQNQLVSPSNDLRKKFYERMKNFLTNDNNIYFYSNSISKKFTTNYKNTLLDTVSNTAFLKKPGQRLTINQITQNLNLNQPTKRDIISSIKKSSSNIQAGKKDIKILLEKIEK